MFTFARPRRRRAFALAGALVLVLLCGVGQADARQKIATVAVFPVENLTGKSFDGEEVRAFLARTLAANGIAVVPPDVLEGFMARHRVRYTAGIDAGTAAALRKEAGADAVLFASIELAQVAVPPKIALIARLVSLAEPPTVLWADDVGLAGDDAPGLFELGIVNDYPVLLARAVERITGSLLRYVGGGNAPAATKAASKFRPKSAYRRLELATGRRYTIAVVPFVNLSARRNAGDVLALLFMRHLASLGEFQVVERGATRQQLLDARIIMDGGLSLSDADTVAALIEADFVLGGRVVRYDDYEGAASSPRVEFSTVLIDRRSRKVVWSSASYNEGNDGVGAFGRGGTRTAHAMATQMAWLTTQMIAGTKR
jgi:TolB-like protein